MAKSPKRNKPTRARPKKKPPGKPEPEPLSGQLIHAEPEQLVGKYCNVAFIHHTNREFILDFVWRLPDFNTLVSRVITSPAHAKAISSALNDNIRNFEKKFGEIQEVHTKSENS
jgi:hypothetical protein